MGKIIKIKEYCCKNRCTDKWNRKGSLGKEGSLYKNLTYDEILTDPWDKLSFSEQCQEKTLGKGISLNLMYIIYQNKLGMGEKGTM